MKVAQTVVQAPVAAPVAAPESLLVLAAKTEEEAADISKSTKEVSKATVGIPVQKEDESQSVASTMMPSWNKSAKKWDIPISWDNSKGLLPYSSLAAVTDIYRQQKKEVNRQRCLAKL